MKKIWIRYSVNGWVDSDAYKDEVEFRTRVLGPNHWSSISSNGEERTIGLHVSEEEAELFMIKFPGCRVDKTMTRQHNIKTV